jgi:hypothetical protein
MAKKDDIDPRVQARKDREAQPDFPDHMRMFAQRGQAAQAAVDKLGAGRKVAANPAHDAPYGEVSAPLPVNAASCEVDIRRKAADKNVAPPHAPREYECIEAWGIHLGSFGYYVQEQQHRAASEHAPFDAIYKGDDGTWHRASALGKGHPFFHTLAMLRNGEAKVAFSKGVR